jgi:hypothetical protein
VAVAKGRTTMTRGHWISAAPPPRRRDENLAKAAENEVPTARCTHTGSPS